MENGRPVGDATKSVTWWLFEIFVPALVKLTSMKKNQHLLGYKFKAALRNIDALILKLRLLDIRLGTKGMNKNIQTTYKDKPSYFDSPFPKVRTSTSSLPDEQKLKPAKKTI